MLRGSAGRIAYGVVVAILAVLAAVVLPKAFEHPVPSERELAAALQDSGIARAQARCVASAVYDSLDDDQLRDLIERGASGAPKDDPDREGDAADRLAKAMERCRQLDAADPPATSTTTPSQSSVPTTAAGGASSTVPSTSEASFDTVPDTSG